MKHLQSLSAVFILLAILLAMLRITILPVVSAHAATLIVTNASDSGPGSLRGAIANASGGDTITFDNDYTITLASQLEIINKTVTITGAGHAITISGNNAVRVFHVGDYDTASSGNLTLDHLSIVNGRNIYNPGDPLCNGQAVACGGGLLLDYLTTATVSNSTFSNNDGGIQGGAIYSYYGNPLTVTNSTFINNHALAYAGAIQVFYGSATLTNNTFTGNSATLAGGYGGAILNNWGTVTFRNNIFANNSATNGGNCDNSGGTFNENGGNLVWGDTSDCPGVNGNPLLGTLGDYGGGPETIPLLPGSPAINAASANCPAVDARGVSRGATCDSGAFESRGFTFGTPTGTPQSAVINTAFGTPLGVAVTSAFGEPVDEGVIAFAAPASGPSTTFTPTTNAAITGGMVSLGVAANGIPGGPYSVTASANGVSGTVTFSLTNDKMPATTWVSSSANPSVYGQLITFTATVTSGATGTVAFTEGTTVYCAASAVSGTTATCGTSALSAGDHTITATYSGDEAYSGSSGTANQAVNRAGTMGAITGDFPDPSTIGQAVTVSYTVTPVAPGSGTLTGNVTVSDGVNSCTGTVAAGSCSIALTTSGARTLTATYAGDGNFDGSSGTAEHTVLSQSLLSITRAGTGNGTVTTNISGIEGNGINCGADCSETYNHGTIVMLTATSANGSTFGGWSGDPDCTDGQVTMNAPVTCTAAFNLVTTVTIPAATGHGTIMLTAESPGCGFYNVSAKTEEQVSNDPSYDYPYGLVEFRLNCAAADVTIAFPGSITGATYRKYGPTTPGNATTTMWYTFNNVTLNGSTSITLHLTDGQLGDDTGVDGIIVDEGGPGQPGGNGTVAVPTMTKWGIIILIGFLGIGSVYYLRRRSLATQGRFL